MRGLSLVEVLVSILIFSFIFIAIFNILSSGQASWYTADVQIELQQEIRKALMVMNTQLRQSGSSVISGVPADDNYYTSITFKIPQDLDGDGDVIDSIGNIEWSNNITYSLDSNRILRTVEGGATSILANQISNLRFLRPSGAPNIIEIGITAQKDNVFGRSLQLGVSSSVKMRN